MAKKKIQQPKLINLCKDCEHCKIDSKNLNWEGKPFTGHCFLDGMLKIYARDGCATSYIMKKEMIK